MSETSGLSTGVAGVEAQSDLSPFHWLYGLEYNVPPMGLRTGMADPRREDLEQIITDAVRFAIRASTLNGRPGVFDPDAMVQNVIVGLLGYHTPTGLSRDKWANPTVS